MTRGAAVGVVLLAVGCSGATPVVEPDPRGPDARITLDVVSEPVVFVAERLKARSGVSVVARDSDRGRPPSSWCVTVALKDLPFEKALHCVAEAAHADLGREGDGWVLARQSSAPPVGFVLEGWDRNEKAFFDVLDGLRGRSPEVIRTEGYGEELEPRPWPPLTVTIRPGFFQRLTPEACLRLLADATDGDLVHDPAGWLIRKR